MSTALGSRRCATTGCMRKVEVHADGRCIHAYCDRCESARLTRAFGAPEVKR